MAYSFLYYHLTHETMVAASPIEHKLTQKQAYFHYYSVNWMGNFLVLLPWLSFVNINSFYFTYTLIIFPTINEKSDGWILFAANECDHI